MSEIAMQEVEKQIRERKAQVQQELDRELQKLEAEKQQRIQDLKSKMGPSKEAVDREMIDVKGKKGGGIFLIFLGLLLIAMLTAVAEPLFFVGLIVFLLGVKVTMDASKMKKATDAKYGLNDETWYEEQLKTIREDYQAREEQLKDRYLGPDSAFSLESASLLEEAKKKVGAVQGAEKKEEQAYLEMLQTMGADLSPLLEEIRTRAENALRDPNGKSVVGVRVFLNEVGLSAGEASGAEMTEETFIRFEELNLPEMTRDAQIGAMVRFLTAKIRAWSGENREASGLRLAKDERSGAQILFYFEKL